MFASWHDINFLEVFQKSGHLSPLPRRKPDQPGGRYLINAVAAFDIETSRIDLPIPAGAKQNSHSFMYIWQFQIEDYTVIGRTWEDFFNMVDKLHNVLVEYGTMYNLPTIPRLIIWVHNLSYEWQFLQGIYQFNNDDVFLREARKPIYCRMFDCLEFRCSYLQTNMSLAHLCKQMGVEEKLSGQKFDYSIIRYPWTELNDYELEYCVRDVRSLVACMKKRMQKDGDTLQTIPYTSTGYVRRDCKAALKPKPLCYDIRDMKPNIEVYRMLRQAFRGGNTHANRHYAGKILENVSSYDMTSCYPAQQLTKKFPMKPFKFLTGDLSIERILKYIGLGYAVVATYIFKDIRIKKGVTIPYISLARTRSTGFAGGIDNGRILFADVCECTLTELDLDIIRRQYDFSTISVKAAMLAKKDYLPKPYRAVIQKYYDDKTLLKGATDEEDLYRYARSKGLLNSVFGMSCQDPIHAEILYDNGNYTAKNLYDDPEEARKALQRAAFPYQWGVYVTAYARKALQDAIDAAGSRMVYCDTDSVKVLGSLDLSAINSRRQKLATSAGAFADDRKGCRHYMGVFEYEGTYDRFITQGAKRYAFEKDGKMSITVSGVVKTINEKTGVPFAVEELGSLEKFTVGFIWKKAAGNMSVYNDNDQFSYTDPETGKSVVISPNVAIIPTTYEMGYSKDYKKLLEEIELYGEYVDRRS